MPEDIKELNPTAVSRDVSTLPKEKQGEAEDIFLRDWVIAERYWLRKHKVWDYGYLNYKSILTNTNAMGADYLRAFGLNVFVPRTYQTIEAISSQLNGARTEFVIKGASGPNGFLDQKRARYFQTMDNTEWRRSEAEIELRAARKNALLFGNGYLLNIFADERETVMVPELDEEKDTAPESANTPGNERTLNVNDPKSLNWVEKEITRYRGVRVQNENPYYIFPDPSARGDNWRYCYRYVPGTVEQIREFVVAKGWMSKEQAFKVIQATGARKYDAIRDTIDSIFELPVTPYTRGDHATVAAGVTLSQPNYSPDEKGLLTALIERYENNYYEVRLADGVTVIYKDWNIYPHKEIPIQVIKDNPVPDEPCGIGEPELLRSQQIEENKLHNLLLDSTMMAVVQRYAVNANLLEDPTDISFHNPFKPIRLKPLPGISVAQAIMPLPQPEVKDSPFRLLDQIKQIAQATTGASDFVVSANQSIADTATESNNLLAATTMRIKDKARQINEMALPRLIKQWHAMFYYFYDEEMDFVGMGEDTFIRWLPFDRRLANTDASLIQAAGDALNARGETLEDVYRNAGYEDVVFLSDVVDGSFNVEIRVTDVEADKRATFEDLLRVAKVANEANTVAKENGDGRRLDSFAVILEALKNVTSLSDVKQYLTGAEKLTPKMQSPEEQVLAGPMPGKSAGADGLTGVRQGQTTDSASIPDVGADLRATGAIGRAQSINSGINV